MKTLYVEGEGLLVEDGRFFPEANVRAAVEKLNDIVVWWESLPPETRAAVEARLRG